MRQLNRNPLLSMDIGADGLKTGDIADSGFGLVGSAVQNGQRLIVVLNGLKTATDRAEEARKMFELGLSILRRRELCSKRATSSGRPRSTAARRAKSRWWRQSRSRSSPRTARATSCRRKSVYRGPLVAPVAEGVEVGRLKIWRGPSQVLDVPLKTGGSGRAGNAEPARARRRAWSWLAGSCARHSRRIDDGRVRARAGSSRSRAGRESASRRRRAYWRSDWSLWAIAVVVTREPGGSPGAEALREVILSGKAAPFGPAGEAILFSAARIDHIDNTIAPALDARRLGRLRPFRRFDAGLSGRGGQARSRADRQPRARRRRRRQARPDADARPAGRERARARGGQARRQSGGRSVRTGGRRFP